MVGGSANGLLPVFPGSIGELTAVASANRAVLGDLRDGGLRDGANESSDEARGRVEIVTDGAFFRSPADILVRSLTRVRVVSAEMGQRLSNEANCRDQLLVLLVQEDNNYKRCLYKAVLQSPAVGERETRTKRQHG